MRCPSSTVLARFPETGKDTSAMDTRQAIIAEIPKLRRFARALTGDAAAADDLVQDCLERALGRVHLWRENTNLRTWLFTILRNIHLNQLRRSTRRPRETSYDEMPEPPGETAATQGHAMTIRDLGLALDKLPDQQREVVLLVGLEDMSYKETAEILGVPVGTVMSRLARGRKALGLLMDGGDPDGAPSSGGAP